MERCGMLLLVRTTSAQRPMKIQLSCVAISQIRLLWVKKSISDCVEKNFLEAFPILLKIPRLLPELSIP